MERINRILDFGFWINISFYSLHGHRLRLHKSCPHPQPLSQAWERGAIAAGYGGVRAKWVLRYSDCDSAKYSYSLTGGKG
jgi:hypothetical protein